MDVTQDGCVNGYNLDESFKFVRTVSTFWWKSVYPDFDNCVNLNSNQTLEPGYHFCDYGNTNRFQRLKEGSKNVKCSYLQITYFCGSAPICKQGEHA